MARIGFNPLRNAFAPVKAPRVVAAVITHLPDLNEPYHCGRLEVVKACLVSMRDNARTDAAITVWDNGSCAELRNWLENEYRPDTLILSGNVGKSTARSYLIQMQPKGTILGVSDDDMLFYPGWLAASIQLLQHFPDAGQVSAWPVRFSFRWATATTTTWAQRDGAARLKRGRFISDQQERDYAVSIGIDPKSWLERTRQDEDYLIEYRGMAAFATAQHCQFVCYPNRIINTCDFLPQAMGDERPFDDAINRMGLLRLTTRDRYARHMGNAIDDQLAAELEGMGL